MKNIIYYSIFLYYIIIEITKRAKRVNIPLKFYRILILLNDKIKI
mgnify:CR=1 FL=1